MITAPPAHAQHAAASPTAAYTLDIARDEAAFLALSPYWDNLVEKAATCSPFLRWDWMRMWWEHCRGEAALAVGVLRDAEGVPQAIAPLMLARETDGARRHLTALSFLSGFGAAHGERLDFIVPAGREDELTPLLCLVMRELRPECDLVRLNFLPQESPNTPHILGALERTFTHASVLNRTACRMVTVPAKWEDIEMRHSASWRGNLRRSCKTFAEAQGSTTVSGAGMLHARAFSELLRLHAANFPEGVSTFTTPEAALFHQRLAEKWLPSGRALMPLLHAEGTMVSAIYGFIERDEFFQYQAGWDTEQARLSPGKMAVRWALICCMQRGLRVYDMLPGEYEYKRRWGDSTRWLLDLEAHNPASWRARTFHALRSLRRQFANTQAQEDHTS